MATILDGEYSKYPPDIRDAFARVAGETCALREKWLIYHRFFMEDESLTNLLSERLDPISKLNLSMNNLLTFTSRDSSTSLGMTTGCNSRLLAEVQPIHESQKSSTWREMTTRVGILTAFFREITIDGLSSPPLIALNPTRRRRSKSNTGCVRFPATLSVRKAGGSSQLTIAQVMLAIPRLFSNRRQWRACERQSNSQSPATLLLLPAS